MADQKTLRLGTINLNRLGRPLNGFTAMQNRLDKFKTGREQEMKSRGQAMRGASPTERNARLPVR